MVGGTWKLTSMGFDVTEPASLDTVQRYQPVEAFSPAVPLITLFESLYIAHSPFPVLDFSQM